MTTPIDVGHLAPPFNLHDQHDRPHALADYRGRWVVLYFYPRDATSGCTKQACGFRDSSAALGQAGAVVLGVSPDDVASHKKFADKESLNFTLLADPDHAVCEAYGTWQEKSMYGRKYWGVARTTYLIDPDGRVAHRWDKVKVAGHVAAVLKQLQTVQG